MFKFVKSVSRCLKGTRVNLFFLLKLLLFLLCNVCQSHEPVYLNHIAVHIKGGHEEANRVARSTGLINKGQVGSLNDHYVFEIPGQERRSYSHSHGHHEALTEHPQVHWFEQQMVKKRVKRDFQQPPHAMKFVDPDWPNQWYLHNGAYGKFDMNVVPAWQRGFTGKGVVITILDDGIERTHTDLRDNYDPYASYDVNSHDNDPMPRYDPTDENRHGTRCAGEVSAKANNTKCSVGVAYNSRIGGVRMLDGEVYDVVEATSLSFNRTHIDIYSASWGPDDDGRVVDGPGPLAKKSFIDGINQGRDGKGSIFVWASGNGGAAHDSCNCDGYTNSIYTLSISSTSERGTKPWYLEECSSTLATTYSSGAYNEKKIVTDDLHDGCTSTHTGTSASAPLAAGIVALALEANPGLTWRDVQYVTLMAARPEPMNDGQWIVNGLGRKVSLRYGYGLMDGAKMVDLALRWTNVPEQHICEIPSSQANVDLKGGRVVLKIRTNGCQGTNKEVKFLEHVQAKISLTYQRRGDIILHLTSPNGTKSTLLPRRPNDRLSGSFTNWAFLSVHFWGESVAGEWTLEIEDGTSYRSQSSQRGGTLQRWSLVFHGTSVQPVNLRNPNATVPPQTPSTTASTQVSTTTFPKHWVCHSECKSNCTGPTAAQCEACAHYKITSTGECVTACPSTGFYKENLECKPCDPSCDTCQGPLTADCLTCREGLFLMTKGHVCVEKCFEGYYQALSKCEKCERRCLTCEGKSNNCTSCSGMKVLVDGDCTDGRRKVPHHVWLPESIRSVVVILVTICVFLLVFIIVVIGLIYAKNNQYLCWSYKYNKLPCSDKESLVGLTKDDLENEDDFSY